MMVLPRPTSSAMSRRAGQFSMNFTKLASWWGQGGEAGGGVADAQASGKRGGVADIRPDDAALFVGAQRGFRWARFDLPGRDDGSYRTVALREKFEQLGASSGRKIEDANARAAIFPEAREGFRFALHMFELAAAEPGAEDLKAFTIETPTGGSFIDAAAKGELITGDIT